MKRVESDASQVGEERVQHAEDYSVSLQIDVGIAETCIN